MKTEEVKLEKNTRLLQGMANWCLCLPYLTKTLVSLRNETIRSKSEIVPLILTL